MSEFPQLGGQEYTVSRGPLITLFYLGGMAIRWQSQFKIMFANKPVTIGEADYRLRHSVTKFFICSFSARPLNSGIIVFIIFPRSFMSVILSSEITS